MSYEYPPPTQRPAGADQDRTWATLAHLGGILAYFFIGWVPALVIWLVHRERGGQAPEQARVALNFQLTLLIALVVAKVVESLPAIGVVGWLAIVGVGIVSLVLSLLAAVAVNKGGTYRYPFTLELVR
ncbi:DUF4870 domain-containing protein [Cellulomonas fimi]|uniref:DUF4870 domain-containing protein n=1 Tax=Cellulomonas fimi (strain ATCC 484 / DSM 20113 / JCM 1341 / CCUG 24087 / LMG 16345 / NBRC 15513 / NCIMB 8980 / NCTC 7547 / NRS-133) TaxID=590998 RepID=F4H3D6_CELFA|nr:DUF4870 domain-containing protein [Cellulomonas fimi]AEE46481.1 hypothetical protein Celf_2354 [Cellulomonas fimi ATCC 484]NNH08235.1 DUF4870 domain-containing protein [Cellulomonas fimi]VEH33168.1 Uncharacterized protein conserved in bacteria [Cellulomonas fimi]